MISTPNESILRDPLDSFTDREHILAHFQQLLRSAQAGKFHLLAIKGNSGTGKTFLIEYLSQRICSQMRWQTGVIAFAQSLPDFRSILNGLEDTLKRCVPRQSLKQYRTQRDEYNRSFDEYHATLTISQSLDARDSSSISHNQVSVHVSAELLRRERQLQVELTRALLELAEECEHPLCLFIDGYERLVEADSELVGWLWEEVLIKLAKNAPQSVLVVTCGWEHPLSAAIQPFSTSDELDDFDQQRLKDYLQAQGILPHEISAQEPLISAFYDLSRGHPLVLSLAVIYFQALPEAERTPQSLQTGSTLVNEEARVQWLEERLLKRLKEPYRTLLEYGPILRSFDQATLKALLKIRIEGKSEEMMLDDRSYERFLRYPFINRKNAQGDGLLSQPAFHDLVRKVRIEALRRLHPETKQQLHRAMAEYYGGLIETEQQRLHQERAVTSKVEHSTLEIAGQKHSLKSILVQALRWFKISKSQARPSEKASTKPQVKSSEKAYTEWLAEIPEQEFRAQLEFLYHALQVKEMQVEAFNTWEELVSRVVNRWQRKQAGPLLELVQQVVTEGEAFFARKSNPYGQYLIWYSRFLEQEARWNDACLVLQEAVRVFEQVGNPAALALSLNNIGEIYSKQGDLTAALDYHQRALSLNEQVGNPAAIATSLNNIGAIYDSQGQLATALDYYKRALFLDEQVGNPADIATSLNNIGEIYRQQGELPTALDSHQRALSLKEQVGNPAGIAQSLNNIGAIYKQQGELPTALDSHQRALSLREQVGNPADIAGSLNNIGGIYYSQGELPTALDYYERALSLYKQVGNPADIATSLNNIGEIYRQQGELPTALDYYERALSLKEQVGNPAHIALSLNNIGAIYDSQGQLATALDYYERALSLKEQVGNPADIAMSLNNIGFIYSLQGELPTALDYYERALFLDEQVGNPADIAMSLNNIGEIYRQQGELATALDYHKRALSLREQVGNPAHIALSCHNIGFIYRKQEQWQDAIALFSRALSLYERMGRGFDADVVDELEGLAICYANLGEIEKAESYEVRAKQIREQLQKGQA